MFPIHAWGPPRSVEEFIDKLEPRGVRYTFAIASCGGTAAATLPRPRKALRQKGSDPHAGFIVRSPGYMDLGGRQPPMIDLVRRLSDRLFPKDSERLPEIMETVRNEKHVRIERNALPGALLGSFFHDKAAPRFARRTRPTASPRRAQAAAHAPASARAATSSWRAESLLGTMSATTAAPAPRGARRMQSASRSPRLPRAATIPRWQPRFSSFSNIQRLKHALKTDRTGLDEQALWNLQPMLLDPAVESRNLEPLLSFIGTLAPSGF